MKGIELKGIPTYLDMQATTPLDPRVLDQMLPFWTTNYGNPHSRTHLYGWESEDAVEVARAQVASLVGTSVLLQCACSVQTALSTGLITPKHLRNRASGLSLQRECFTWSLDAMPASRNAIFLLL